MHARGDAVRAAVILAQGLKREPRDSEAVGWLLHLYVEELPNPGIESDLLKVLSLQPNGADLLAIVRAELGELGSGEKLKAIDKTLDHSPMRFTSSGPPEPEPPPQTQAPTPHGAHSNDAPRSEFVSQADTQDGGESWAAFDSPFDHTGRIPTGSAEPAEEPPAAEPSSPQETPRQEAPSREPQLADEELSASIDLALSQPLGTIDDLPASLKREYLGDESASGSSSKPMVWAIIVGVALLCIAAIVGYASKSKGPEAGAIEPPSEWEPVEEAAPEAVVAAEGQVAATEGSAEAEGSAAEVEIIEAPTDGEGE